MPSLIPGYEYDIFISYRQKDNKYDGWVTEFVTNLKKELEATFKDEVSVYFDENPHDGLLETHQVGQSLSSKVKSLIFIPIISQTYCDPNSFAWQNEFVAFNKLSKEDPFGREIKLSTGNVASRVLPVKIHDLDKEDKALLEQELGGVLRSVEFIYKSVGVNRPLKPNDDRAENLNHTYYRDQINKVANAVKEIINGLKSFDGKKEESGLSSFKAGEAGRPKRTRSRSFIFSLLVIAVLAAAYFLFPRLKGKVNVNNISNMDKSIAVLPFENMTNDPEQQYFSDGLTEGILNSLAHMTDLKVPARTSSFLLRGKDVQEVGRKLHVHTVLEGSVQRQGDRIRITAQLINVEDGYHFWSQQYDEKADDVFALQDKIANAIAEKLEVTLLGSSGEIKTKKPTLDKKAYELYLKGRFFWNKRLPSEVKKGINFFNRAIDLDPLYAEAYSGIADCYTALGYGSFLSPNEAFPKAKEAADKALELDSTLAEPHASLGYFKLYYDRDWEGAEKEFQTSIRLNPKYEIAYDWYGYYLTAMGRFEEARVTIKKAVDLDPLSPVFGSDMGFTLFYGGNYDQAIKELQSALEISPQFPLTHLWLSRAYQQKKMYKEAIDEYRKTLMVIPNWPVALAGIGNIYGEMKKTTEAQRMLDTLTMLSSREFVTSYGVALVYAGLGDKDKAFQWLDKSYEERSNFLVWLKVEPRWAHIRSDKRFAELVRRVGLPN